MPPTRLLISSALPRTFVARGPRPRKDFLRTLLLALAETPAAPARDNIRSMKWITVDAPSLLFGRRPESNENRVDRSTLYQRSS